MEWITLGLFCAALLACIAFDLSILIALAFGLLLFLLYGLRKGCPLAELLKTAAGGVWTVRNILITFLLIGILTAFWRASGTIPVIVYYASELIRPSVFLLMTFLLNCVVSVLTGTSFGTAATMGVICSAMGLAMGVDIRLIGGAVLSGVFFGDRCSPVSTSALLVAELTGTNIFDNIRRMLRSAFIPFLMTCAVYALLGFLTGGTAKAPDLRSLFGREFSLQWPALIPAAVILILSAFRIGVKISMTASIIASVPICLLLQHTPPAELLRMAFTGFHAADAEVGAMIDGGGILSMLRVAGIVCLSSSFSGIFRKTGLLDGTVRSVKALAARTTSFAAMVCTSVLTGMIACNQTLTVMLTHQLCGSLVPDRSDLANDLEDSAIVIAPMIPWSIAGAVPLASIGAPSASILLAFYLFLIPLWKLILSVRKKRKTVRTMTERPAADPAGCGERHE